MSTCSGMTSVLLPRRHQSLHVLEADGEHETACTSLAVEQSLE